MRILVQLFAVTLLLVSTACIGASPYKNYGDSSSAVHGDTEVDEILNKTFVGRTRDDLIITYGPPGRTATLDSGYKLMQYNRKTRSTDEYGNVSRRNCELRLWLRDKKVAHVDYRGDQYDCLHFAVSARQNVVEDDRRPKTK